MRTVLYPQLASDTSTIMEYDEQIATPELADEFYREFRQRINEAVDHPDSFSVREQDLRRTNLRRFPTTFCSVSSATQ